MKYPHLPTEALLEHLGLQAKPSATTQALTFGALILGGVVVGAAAALLLAPKSGRALRGDLRDGAQQLGTAVSAKAQGAVAAVRARVPASMGGNGEAHLDLEDDLVTPERT